MSMKNERTALVILGNGFEELEALAPVDLLRRAGVSCRMASAEPELWVTGRSGIRVEADVLLSEMTGLVFDALIIPGGPGTGALRKNSAILEMVRAQREKGKMVAAICAAPTVLLEAGVLPGPRHTGHMTVAAELPDMDEGSAVVTDGGVMTARGAGSALAFGMALVSALAGEEVSNQVGDSIHYGL
uniref:4-methyl-5(B-hydroxyethyl)-thiazole monophosphate biosynthesis n=1 Tax=Candidatus Kentrum sp. MB TaxID=2138164 RepID=A0A451BAQ7_9GAMM|nr:MAG: 4-methyl-5(b-hydroxyethyl)-thiazole monophosphate biosynthesis [Candidatus Kentron sp. MB]VFK31161.1 MAG: 4-methyl-5(b-hydroxyethyl)-thiazole monophosphate biosynthesis [Candidatus Kentron sp. MB]VFK75369.1 MAG: 4-methyl-5(b-hydroxyethyl)-thiazole monophosphate biosynthesis [Candidatus Kentron sp. MB]